ncbi:matrixin family metalloprotease [Verrucomicrobiaceae bacterium R5-34]|nr:matrixin family metalloprotease [Verrucomicrobiaceae bacterium R5-34]
MSKKPLITSSLSQGAKGVEVEKLRTYLSNLGYLKPSTNSSFDKDVTNSLRVYQGAFGLDPTGELDLPTVELLNTPRCGVADFGGYDYIGCRWSSTHLKWSLTSGGNTISKTDARKGLIQAFDTWAQVSKLTFEEVAPDKNAQLPVSFHKGDHGDGAAFDNASGVLAHAFYPPTCGGTYSGHIHFDDSETWTMDASVESGKDFITVAIHEIGHALGLDHERKVKAVMQPHYKNPERNLYADDIRGIQSIYGKP